MNQPWLYEGVMIETLGSVPVALRLLSPLTSKIILPSCFTDTFPAQPLEGHQTPD